MRLRHAGPAGVLDAMLEALAGSGAMIVVDEVQNAERIVARATGIAGLLAVVSHAGLPLHESANGWFELIGPVQQMLMARAPVTTGVLTAAAAAYAEEGRSDLAVGLLIGA